MANGYESLYTTTTGALQRRPTVFFRALQQHDGNFNTRLARGPLSNTTGSNNVALGTTAGFALTP